MACEEIGTEPRTSDRSGWRPGVLGPRARAWRTPLTFAAVVLAAFNLRPAVTSLGAALDEVRSGLGMSGLVAGGLTAAPALCFAVMGPVAPRLARRFGPGAVMSAAMAAVTAGLLIRPHTGATVGFLLAGVPVLAGIAVGNVLLPAVVKRWFPTRVGPVTGLYSMALALGSAVAAGGTVPLIAVLGGDWRLGLAAWAVPAAVALPVWLALAGGRGVAPWEPPFPTVGPASAPRLARSPTAWALAVFFGLQATAAYVAMGWTAQIFRDAGVSPGRAGLLLALTMATGVPLAFVVPRLAARSRRQGHLVLLLGCCGAAAYAGLVVAPTAGAWLWATLLGVSTCAFPLALTMIGMRARTGEGVVRLSAFVQSVGYLLSLPGPLIVGALHEHDGGWTRSICLMGALLVPQAVAGVLAGRPRAIEDEAGR
ncbi:CynX/NimT family MFS transporter [Streptomyces sp. WMMC905]|uniref:CynX/NimT family MFS transporter n=1 Tax=Streptomyces sp. WMMC905 TaxID=3404123 RepID=UPI003B93F688